VIVSSHALICVSRERESVDGCIVVMERGCLTSSELVKPGHGNKRNATLVSCLRPADPFNNCLHGRQFFRAGQFPTPAGSGTGAGVFHVFSGSRGYGVFGITILLYLGLLVYGLGDVSLQWNLNSETNILGYKAYAEPQDGPARSFDAGSNTTLAIYPGPGLTRYTVTAYNESGESEPSEPAFFAAPQTVNLNVPTGAAGWVETSFDLRSWTPMFYTTQGGAFSFPINPDVRCQFFRFLPSF
jgi:hypothetical protein